jgi:tetratricopeptide (TPR) repeat protein
MFNGLFRKRASAQASGSLREELAALERRASAAAQGYETQFLIRAGDLCSEAGEGERAMGYYGRAIDAYLESGRFNAAEAVCQKLLRISPRAVRARCTLAWLHIGSGNLQDAIGAVEAYVAASAPGEQEELAARQLVMMAEATSNLELREQLGGHLLDLGELKGADAVFGGVFQVRNGLAEPPATDEHILWERMLRASLMGPEQLRADEEFAAALTQGAA